MPSDSAPVLVDTNVLVYAYDPSDPSKQERAAAALESLFSQRRGVLTTQILGEFFVTVTRKIPLPLSMSEGERRVANYAAAWPIHPISTSTVTMAIAGVRRFGLHYFDALIWASAREYGAKTVLSEDFTHGARLGGVLFVNPFADDGQRL